jgi:hypothetical protein
VHKDDPGKIRLMVKIHRAWPKYRNELPADSVAATLLIIGRLKSRIARSLGARVGPKDVLNSDIEGCESL